MMTEKTSMTTIWMVALIWRTKSTPFKVAQISMKIWTLVVEICNKNLQSKWRQKCSKMLSSRVASARKNGSLKLNVWLTSSRLIKTQRMAKSGEAILIKLKSTLKM